MRMGARDALRFHRPHLHLTRPFGNDAAPLILLSQTREADRERALATANAEQREAIARETLARQDAAAVQARQIRLLLESNTALTAEVVRLTRRLHRHAFATANGTPQQR